MGRLFSSEPGKHKKLRSNQGDSHDDKEMVLELMGCLAPLQGTFQASKLDHFFIVTLNDDADPHGAT